MDVHQGNVKPLPGFPLNNSTVETTVVNHKISISVCVHVHRSKRYKYQNISEQRINKLNEITSLRVNSFQISHKVATLRLQNSN